MLKAYKYRLYPTESQKVLINKHIGACRFVYNLALEVKNYAYINQRKTVTCFDLIKQITDLKKECEWLKEISICALQQSVINLDKAFTKFFKGQNRFPVFKKKNGNKQSYRIPIPRDIKIKEDKIQIPKFKEGIKWVQDRIIKGEIKQATVTHTATDKYYISILVETGEKIPDKKSIEKETSVGIDLGIKTYIATSEGIGYNNPKWLKNSQKRLKVIQKRASRKKKGSANRKKANKKVALLHEKVANQRKDWLHKVSTELIKNHDSVCCEDLNISGMMKNHKLAGVIQDAGWGMFVEMLKYKSEWYGKNLLQIPTFQASTKVCSSCGTIKQGLTLADREWDCEKCGDHHERDVNAARVIKQYCITKYSRQVLPGESVEMSTIVGSMKQKNT